MSTTFFTRADAPSAEGILRRHAGDLADPAWLSKVLAGQPVDAVFHLASIPGGSAEANYALARRVNLDATIDLLERGQAQVVGGGPAPVSVFASTIAVFGAMPPVVSEDTLPRPALTYGAQKLVGEILIDDFSRRGWVDGRSLRIPGVLAAAGTHGAVVGLPQRHHPRAGGGPALHLPDVG